MEGAQRQPKSQVVDKRPDPTRWQKRVVAPTPMSQPVGTYRPPVLQMQQTLGNRFVARQIDLQREGEETPEKAPEGPKLVWDTIEGEDVQFMFPGPEEEEARSLIKTLKDVYGIKLDSAKGIEAIKDQYDDVPASVTNSLTKRQWRMIDLRSLVKCMEHYAAITGGEREKSTRAGNDQEVAVIGKVKNAIDTNTSAGKLDTTTLGEYFKATKAVNLFQAQEGKSGDFPGDEGAQLVGTFVHEMAHGLLAYAYDSFVKETGGYWKNRYSKSGKRGKEAPINDYACTNAQEDLAETAMFFFVKPEVLLNGLGGKKGKVGNATPLRHAFMTKITNDWIPPPPPVKVEGGPTEPVTSESVKSVEKPPKKPFWKFWK